MRVLLLVTLLWLGTAGVASADDTQLIPIEQVHKITGDLLRQGKEDEAERYLDAVFDRISFPPRADLECLQSERCLVFCIDQDGCIIVFPEQLRAP